LPPHRRLVPLLARLRATHPDVCGPEILVKSGRVLVDGRVIVNTRAQVPADAAIVIRRPASLRGATKLAAALRAFDVRVAGRVAVDVGAAVGGFTSVLLDAGAERVYAVDAGFGQFLGSLRLDPRVVNLERTNLGDLNTVLVPEVVDLITMDLSYLRLADAVPQLNALTLAPDADLVALVKPVYELGLGHLPEDAETALTHATDQAARVAEQYEWRILGSMVSPVRGSRGAVEGFVQARRDPTR
jgi:23S rRNA (cytidine1920-2'-O)/16S rRNA (cytidine1409-2'-O)-methyltransferase